MTSTKVTTFIIGSKQPRETTLKHDVLLEKRKKAKGAEIKIENDKIIKEEESKVEEKPDKANI